MGKSVNNVVLDQPLDYVIANADKMVVCVGEPVDFNDANVTKNLAEQAMVGGDYTKADGAAGDGRRITVAAKSAVLVTADGTADHVALLDTTNSVLLYVTTAPSTGLLNGSTVDIGAWDIQYNDPT